MINQKVVEKPARKRALIGFETIVGVEEEQNAVVFKTRLIEYREIVNSRVAVKFVWGMVIEEFH
ncbi:hypothetical protein MJA45_25045 [Paenibacillus aurantius]|uniref:Uncharacterized protein n=1 Tax=Paenibacillus aurantius TaxID=2918900 RepID=A0AA96LCW2_9BACL|nr:hypothetical protein [Paenibacillus aurantius]WNQ10849.1 hypothetical protein MJA45_25045 [Paenibacillus aurantius]